MTKTVIFILLVLIALMAAFIFSRQARAHDWFPQSCCHNTDCYKAKPGEVSFIAGGYLVSPDNITMPFNDKRIHYGENPTTEFYVCRTGKKMTNAPHCIFPPGPGT